MRIGISLKSVSLALASLAVGFLLSQALFPHGFSLILAEGEVTITVKQVGDYPAKWALLSPGQRKHTESNSRLQTLSGSAGNYTLILTEPPGYKVQTEISVNEEEVSESDSRTVTASTQGGTLDFLIRVIPDFEELGVVSVNSNLAGLAVLLKGPLGTETVTTPAVVRNAPPGLWTAYVKLGSETCPDPRPMSQRLPPNAGRVSFIFEIDTSRCDALPTAIQSNAETRRQARFARRRGVLPSSLSQAGEEREGGIQDFNACVSELARLKFQINALTQQLKAVEGVHAKQEELLNRRNTYFQRRPPEGDALRAERPLSKRD